MRIGIDLDGVGYDFQGAFGTYLDAIGELPPDDATQWPPATRWTFYEDWGFSTEQFLDHCDDGVNADMIFRKGEPFPGFVNALHDLKALGHTLHIVTDRSFGHAGASEQATMRWLADHSIPFDTITFSRDKTIVGVDMFVDDKAENYDALEAAGVEVWLFDRPWNQHVKDARRVFDMQQFVERVTETDDKNAEDMETLRERLFPRHQKELMAALDAEETIKVEVRTVSKTGGEKGTKLARYDLIPTEPMRLLAEHYGRGARKYADNNWRRGYKWSNSYAAGSRHWADFWAGKDYDTCPEDGAGCQHVDMEGKPFASEPGTCFNHTGSLHIVAALWHAVALTEFTLTFPEYDDRYKKD